MFAEDLSAFFQSAEFADAAGYLASGAGGDRAPVLGIFDNGYDAALGGVMDGGGPTYTCARASVPGVTQGATLLFTAPDDRVPAAVCTVVDVQPDGTGLVVLRLELTP